MLSGAWAGCTLLPGMAPELQARVLKYVRLASGLKGEVLRMGEHSALEETMYIVLSGSVGVAAVRKRLLQAEREGRYGYEEVETQQETVVATIGERFGGLHLDEVTSRALRSADLHGQELKTSAGCAGDG